MFKETIGRLQKVEKASRQANGADVTAALFFISIVPQLFSSEKMPLSFFFFLCCNIVLILCYGCAFPCRYCYCSSFTRTHCEGSFVRLHLEPLLLIHCFSHLFSLKCSYFYNFLAGSLTNRFCN